MGFFDTDIFQYDAYELNPDLKSENVTEPGFIKRLTPMTWVVVGFGNPVQFESREMCIEVRADEIVCRRELGNGQHEIRIYSQDPEFGDFYEREGSGLIEMRRLRKVFDPA